MTAKYKGIHLPLEQWPTADRAAWAELFRTGDLLDGCGAASHWAEGTRKTNLKHYSRWLGWLAAKAEMELGCTPAQRATLVQVRAYAGHLIETCSRRTAASALIGLKCVLQRMAPEQDWRWLKDLTNRVDVWADGIPKRTRKILSAEQVFHGALAELERLAGVVAMSRTDQIRYRDALMIAVLICCPVRLRNLTQITIGRHLLKVGSEWQLSFAAGETKTHQPLRYVLSAQLAPRIEFYLAEVRPGFPGARDHKALWLGSKRSPLAYETIYSRVVLITRRLFGQTITPHDFRSIAATALADHSPEAALFARPLLGHRKPETTQKHYTRANQLLAGAKVNAVLKEVRDGGTRRWERSIRPDRKR